MEQRSKRNGGRQRSWFGGGASITALAFALIGLAACDESQPPPVYPSPGHPVPPGHPPPPRAPANTALANALTPFGVLLQQLPQLPLPLPPLPTPDQWMKQYWPLPWPQPLPPAPAPGPPPGQPGAGGWPPQWAALEDQVLRETNAYRAQGAQCGDRYFGPAPAVGPHPQLRASARGHSRDMAQRGYFAHRSPEGVSPMQRAQAAGYPGGFVGENIAAGYPSVRDVVRGWIESPGHCVNIMEPRYRYLGVGFWLQSNDRYGEYWTQNFGG